MENTQQSKKIETVRKLLAKAQSLGDTPEAHACLETAGALMRKHGIEQEQLAKGGPEKQSEIVSEYIPITNRGGHGPDRAMSAAAVAHAFGCTTLYRLDRTQGKKPNWLIMVGPKHIIENLKILIPEVLDMAERGGKAIAKSTREELRGYAYYDDYPNKMMHEVTQARRAFLKGFGEGYGRRIRELNDKLHDAGSGSENAAVSASQELVFVGIRERSQRKADELYPNTRTVRTKFSQDGYARSEGHKAGYHAASPKIGRTAKELD